MPKSNDGNRESDLSTICKAVNQSKALAERNNFGLLAYLLSMAECEIYELSRREEHEKAEQHLAEVEEDGSPTEPQPHA